MKHTVFALSIMMGLLLSSPARAQNNGTPYDCLSVFSFTAASSQTGQNNSSSASPCVAWRVTYTSTGFSSVTVYFETSPDNSSWTPITNSICSSSVQPPCVTDGANPLAAGVMGSSSFRAYGKYVRVRVSSVTGSGSGQVVTYGYKGTSASAGIGSEGGGDMVYPGAGVANSTGSAWAASYSVGPGAGNLVQYDSGSPAVTFPGSTSGTTVLHAKAEAGTTDLALPAATGTLAWTVFSGSLALATSAIASAACQAVSDGTVNSITATGVLSTDTVDVTTNGSIKAVTGYVPSTAGGLTINAFPKSGFVNVDVCNWSADPITPGAVTVNVKVSR